MKYILGIDTAFFFFFLNVTGGDYSPPEYIFKKVPQNGSFKIYKRFKEEKTTTQDTPAPG
jgi:hypothetical protein